MEFRKEFKAVIGIGFDGTIAVIELNSANEQALEMVSLDASEANFADKVGINTEVPGLYLIKAKVNLDILEEQEYSDTEQAVVRYTLPSNAA
jgi:ADP-glucose pyrophosphorylase